MDQAIIGTLCLIWMFVVIVAWSSIVLAGRVDRMAEKTDFVKVKKDKKVIDTPPPPSTQDSVEIQLVKLLERVDALEKWKATIEGD